MKNKKIIISIITISIISILIVIYMSLSKVKINLIENLTVEANEKVTNLSFIDKVEKGKLIEKEYEIDTSSLGLKNIKIKVKNKLGVVKEIEFKIKVIDTIAPIITLKSNLEVFTKDEIDLKEYVSVTDNLDEDIDIKVEGDYDINTPGEYKIYFIAKDSSGNESKEEFTLTVKENNKVDSNGNKIMPDRKFKTSKGFDAEIKDGIAYVDGYLIANKTYSLPSDYGNGLTSDTLNAFEIMKNAASSDGLNIYISSGFRSYDTQDSIYNRYVRNDGLENADTYSARPGHSEHQTGLAFDVNIIDESFNNTPEAKWLRENCYKYGFILRYPEGKTNETGYIHESWHFRYVGEDLAIKLYNGGNWITMEDYFGITSKYEGE